MTTNWRHPETQFGEVFLSNVTVAGAKTLDWRYKRLGNVAYDMHGAEINQANWVEKLFPLFVNKTEVDEKWAAYVNIAERKVKL